jgi:GT2 family glycosyltransferase
LIPSATAFHDYSFSKSIQKYYYMERNRIMFLLKNFSLKYLLLILPMFLITEVGLDFFSLKSGFFKERLRAWVYFLKRKHWGPVIEARQHIQKNRIVSYITDIIDFQDLDSEILTKVGNPLFRAYFRAIKPFI